MDEKLHILQHLYGEVEDPEALRRLLEDDALRREYDALAAVKLELDRRPRARPDPRVLDRVAAAAGPQQAAPPGRRQDRAAQPGRTRRRLRLVGAVSTALALVLVVGIGLQQFRTSTPETALEAPLSAMKDEAAPAPDADVFPAEAMTAPQPAPPVPAGAGGRSTLARERAETEPEVEGLAALAGARRADAPPPEAPAPPAEARAAALLDEVALASEPDARKNRLGAASVADSLPAWDEADALLRVHRRIELLEARSAELNWDDAPVMSLDVLPAEPEAAPRGLKPASKKQDGHR